MLCGGRGVCPRPPPQDECGPSTRAAAQTKVWPAPLQAWRVAVVDGSKSGVAHCSIRRLLRRLQVQCKARRNVDAIGMGLDKPIAPLLRKAERDLLPGGDPNTPWRRLAYQLRQAPTLHDLLALVRANSTNSNVWRPHLTALFFVRASALLYPKALAFMAASGGDGSATTGPSPSLKIDAHSMMQILSCMLNKLSVRQIQGFHIARMLVVMSWIQSRGELSERVEATLVRELLRKQSVKLAYVAAMDPPLYGRLVRALAQLAPRDDQLWVELQRLTLASLLEAAAEVKGPAGETAQQARDRRRRLWGAAVKLYGGSTAPDCSTDDLANMAFGFAAANRAMPPLFEALSDAALARDMPPNADTLANLLWAWARAQLPAGYLAPRAAEAFRPLLDTAAPRAVGRVLWSMAALGYRSQAFLAAAGEVIVRRKLVFGSTQELVNVCWAFSHLDVRAIEETRSGQGGAAAGRPALGYSAKEELERAKPRGARRRAPDHVYDSSASGAPSPPASPTHSSAHSSGEESGGEDAIAANANAEGAATPAGVRPGSGAGERPAGGQGGTRPRGSATVWAPSDAPSTAAAATGGVGPTGCVGAESAQLQHRVCADGYGGSGRRSTCSTSGEGSHASGALDGAAEWGQREDEGASACGQPRSDTDTGRGTGTDTGRGRGRGRGAPTSNGLATASEPGSAWLQHQQQEATASTRTSGWLAAAVASEASVSGRVISAPSSGSEPSSSPASPSADPLDQRDAAEEPRGRALAATAVPPQLEPLPLSVVLDAEAARSRAAAQRPPRDPASPYELFRYLAHCFVNGHIDGHEGHKCRWKMSNCQLSVMVASFARAGYGNKSLFYTAARMAMRRIASLSPTDVTLILTAHARVRVRHDALFDSACGFIEARCREFTPRQLANVLWAVQQMQLHARYAQLSEAVRQRRPTEVRTRGDAAGSMGGGGSGSGALERAGADGNWRREGDGLQVPPAMLRLHVPSHLLYDGEWEEEEEEQGREEGDGSMWAASRSPVTQEGEYWSDMGRLPAELEVVDSQPLTALTVAGAP